MADSQDQTTPKASGNQAGNLSAKSERPIITRFSSEYDGPRQYYADTMEEVPITFTEDTTAYKPEYDFETRSINHWWFRNESELFRDVHTKVATFKTRTTAGYYWKALRIMLADKYIWRHL